MLKQRHWSCEDSAAFWAKRRCYMATSYPDIAHKQERCARSMKERLKQEENQKREFYSRHNLHDEDVTFTAESAYNIAKDLTFWMENSSWSYCKTCKLLDPQKLLPSYGKRPEIKTTRQCSCINKRDVCPSFQEIPLLLQNLTQEDIFTLRPLDLHTGDCQRLQHGYRQKKGISRVTWSKTSVEEKIACIDDEDKKRRCLRAYNHLMKTKESSYSKFVVQREAALPSSRGINLYHYQDGDAIECALWPNLYPYTSWCESVVKRQTTRESSKVAFMKNLLSEVIDYNLSY